MGNKMAREGFTLVELLVVIAVIALLMAILMPALARVRVIANRMVCGSHLASIGKGIMMYASDSRERYPVSGLTNCSWSAAARITNFMAKERKDAFADGRATITSCFYLLVRFGELSPSIFVCPDDADTKEFELPKQVKEYRQLWDFGDNPGVCVSYSYHQPFSIYRLSASSSHGSPMCADRNPYLDKNAAEYITVNMTGSGSSRWAPVKFVEDEYSDPDYTGNCAAHQRKAQNVLYNDGHVEAEQYPNVGYNNDNIWRSWPNSKPSAYDMQVGGVYPRQGVASPMGKDDACLVNDRNDIAE